jgi:hypothetical protein
MISNFFVLSPRGDTIIAKQYRNDRGDAGAHERSHTEAFFRRIKFWDDGDCIPGGISQGLLDAEGGAKGAAKEGITGSKTGDAPPVFLMPDGLSYIHVERNGLIVGAATARNVSAVTVVEVCCPAAVYGFNLGIQNLNSHIKSSLCPFILNYSIAENWVVQISVVLCLPLNYCSCFNFSTPLLFFYYYLIQAPFHHCKSL